jgi:amino acid adenylation domain-containing protein
MVQQLVSEGFVSTALAPAGRVASVCAAVAEQAAAGSGRTAVVGPDGRSLTYGELVARSDDLAARLAAEGVGTGSCVAVLVERSVEFVVAAYAVMRTGAAYLPLDVATPQDRLEFVLSDAEVLVVLTDGTPRVPAGPWRCVDVDAGATVPVPRIAPADDRPEDLAYVIYTSGSTGRPKGVELTRANLANLARWHVDAFGITSADRASQVASVGFDAAVWEIWPHLVAGATVCIADEATRRSPQLLRDWLVAERITVAFAPTVLAEQLIHLAWPVETALRTLLTGADVLHRRPADGLPFTLVNNYGPTECTVVATSGPVASTDTGTPSIGRPIADTVALVLDDDLQPVAPGDAGELCLAGTLVGRGYRNDPELTARRFVTLRPDAGPPVRVYRTGDRVRLLDDGEIAFLGRLDSQVKLRGFRIEPAEVVAALDRADGVAASAVVARAGGDGEPELVGYVVAAEGASPEAGPLRSFLSTRLPDYMVPARFVGLAALPVTMNGKLDEGALPPPSPDNLLPGQEEQSAHAAGGSVQDRVGEIVRVLLELPSVDVSTNIFLLGGHSMLAMQLVSRIQQVFGVKLALRHVFGEPTVAGIAGMVAARMPAQRTEAGA